MFCEGGGGDGEWFWTKTHWKNFGNNKCQGALREQTTPVIAQSCQQHDSSREPFPCLWVPLTGLRLSLRGRVRTTVFFYYYFAALRTRFLPLVDFSGKKKKNWHRYADFAARTNNNSDYNSALFYCTSIDSCYSLLPRLLEVPSTPLVGRKRAQGCRAGALVYAYTCNTWSTSDNAIWIGNIISGSAMIRHGILHGTDECHTSYSHFVFTHAFFPTDGKNCQLLSTVNWLALHIEAMTNSIR